MRYLFIVIAGPQTFEDQIRIMFMNYSESFHMRVHQLFAQVLLITVTCDPENFKEKLVVVFTMLNLDLNSWLIRTKNPKKPADEASLYSLCQLYSRHALAYKTGSVCSTLELHGNCSVNELKRHCDIHLVFLEGGILAQLHKKPTIPRLLGDSSATDRSND